MPNGYHSKYDFGWKIDNEGLGYAMLHYFGDLTPDDDSEKEFCDEWNRARPILQWLEDTINEWQSLEEEEEEA